MRDDFENLKLAAKVAIVDWNQSEQLLCRRIQQADSIDAELGKTWLTYWMLARTAPVDQRDALYAYMSRAKRLLSNTNLTKQKAYCLVQKIADAGRSKQGVRGRPLSLVSKLAFSCQPELFAPYDGRARIALKSKGHKTDGDYPAYMTAFNAELAEFKKELNKAGISPQSPICGTRVGMNQNLFYLRAFDKYLMLVGGFSREAMKSVVNGAVSKQHAPKRKRSSK